MKFEKALVKSERAVVHPLLISNSILLIDTLILLGPLLRY